MAEEENKKDEKKVTIKIPKVKIPKVNIWILATVVLSLALLYVLIGGGRLGSSGTTGAVVQVLAPDEAANEAVDYINKYLLQPGTEATLKGVEETENGLYNLQLEIAGREYDSYVTKDGKLLFSSAIDLTETPEVPEQEQPEQPTTSKSDKPEVHAFVMSYCPYGLQFMKAYVPVVELLGDKADLQLNFVHYIMHGQKEIDENNNMYCIQKEQSDKFMAYLRCFIGSDDHVKCVEDVGIDKSKLDSCVVSTDEEFKITELYEDKSTWSGGIYPLYPVDAALAEQYGVRGSPTFVINDQVVSVSRSPEAIKQAVCNAFNEAPEECETTLSSNPEGPGIGPLGQITAGAGTTAACG